MRKVWLVIYFGCSVLFSSAQSKTHTVKQGETLYSIAHSYSLSLSDLLKSNPALSGNTGIQIGQKIFIPTENVKPTTAAKATAKVHTVTKGETAYALCKRYGVSVSEIKQWNNLEDLNLKVGQRLIVSKTNSQAIYKPISVPSTPDTPYRDEDNGIRNEHPKAEAILEQQEIFEKPKQMPVATATPVVTESLRTSSANPTEYPGIFTQYATRGLKMKKNRGAANYLSDATSGNQFLAFYNEAEAGSIIRVTNLMNQKTIFVKVMGKLPSGDSAQEVILKLSNSAAHQLGVIDDKFLVEVASFLAK